MLHLSRASCLFVVLARYLIVVIIFLLQEERDVPQPGKGGKTAAVLNFCVALKCFTVSLYSATPGPCGIHV